MNKKKFTKLLALYLPYLVIGLAATNFGEAWRLAEGKELGDRIVSLIDTLPAAFANPLPSLHPLDILVGICCGAGLRLAVYLKSKNAKKYRHGMEYGSARWGTPADIAPFMAPKFEDNIILTKTERLMMSNRPPDPKNARNKNVLVVGGSGSGKTRYFIKPNLLQCTSKSHPVSFVVTDPKGGLIQECGLALLKNGYKIRTMNTINFHKSMKELVHAEVMLPSHAPPGFADRATLWNAVEAIENQWNSQLARRIVLALPREVPKDQYLPMLKEFCNEQFVAKGMIADFAIHDKGDGNPHAHILLTLRAMDEHGRWLPKARKVYDLDENRERIRLPSGNWKCHKENTVDWNDQKYAEVWRHSWETITNRYLEAAGRPERVDLRSFERQGIQQIPTVHLGPAAHQMEKRGVETFLGNLNRDIRAANSLMQSIRSAIRGLQRWIADLNEKKQLLLDALEKAKEPTLSDLLVDYFNLRNEQRSDWSGKAKLKCTVRDFEEVKRAVDYLKAHSLNTIEDLDTAISNLNQTAAPLRRQLKQNENRMRAIAQIKDAAAVHAKLKPIHDTFIKKNFKLTKDAYAAQHKEELDTFNKAVRTLMKLNGSTAVDFSALDAEFSALQSSSAELRTQLETLQPDISALKNIRKYIDMVLNKQQLSAPGGKTPEKESVLKKLEDAKAAQSQKKAEQKNHTQEL